MIKTMAIECGGSHSLGMGHIMRTLVIAEKLKRTFKIYYISNIGKEYESGVSELKKRGYQVYSKKDKNYADILLLDSYDTDENKLSLLRKKYNKLIYIDDLNSLSYYNCDMLINKNLGAENIKYNTPPECRVLKGTKYALLRKEFQEAPFIKIKEKVKNIFITMGGTDPKNTSAKVLKILKDTPFTFRVAVGSGFSEKTKKELKYLEKENNNIILYENADMAKLMTESDIAVTACGGTPQEIGALGLPQIGIAVAENQNLPLHFGEDNRLLIYGGKEEFIEPSKFLNLFLSLSEDFNKRQYLSESSKKLINKNGIELIEKEIIKLAN